MTPSIITIIEHTNGELGKISLEVLACGRRLADDLKVELIALVCGHHLNIEAMNLGAYGADRVRYVDAATLREFMADAYAQAIQPVIADQQPPAVLIGASVCGRDLAVRLAARMQTPLAMNCLSLSVNDRGQIETTRAVCGGKVIARHVLKHKTGIFALRPNCFPIHKNPRPGVIEPVGVKLDAGDLRFVSEHVDPDAVDLTEAEVVVAGGRGMGGNNFEILETLADRLNGVVGASRSAVDAGWRPFADQIGQTGKSISPNLYIACGISGAYQHLAGIFNAKVIVAINKDAEAPIFNHCDYGVQGNLFEIIPRVSKELLKLREKNRL